jgi:hypothetical protein
MTSFALKIIAMITMFCDHLGGAIYKSISPFNYIGRIAFPIFAFQISEGFSHTKDLKKYLLRLMIFAIISQIPYILFLSMYSSTVQLNIFFTLAFGLIAIWLHSYIHKNISSKIDNRIEQPVAKFLLKFIVEFIPVIALCIIGELSKVDYGWWGILLVFMFYYFKQNKLAMNISFIVMCVIFYGIDIIKYGFNTVYIWLFAFNILPILFINLYNGKQGKKIKYLLYIFYPLHLLILYLLFTFVFI